MQSEKALTGTKLKIKVTKDILEKSKDCGENIGKMSITENCAVALAVRDIFQEAYVVPGSIVVCRPIYIHITLPPSANHFINLFDKASEKERPLLPELEFEVDIPDILIEAINIDEIKLLLENHPTLQLVLSK